MRRQKRSTHLFQIIFLACLLVINPPVVKLKAGTVSAVQVRNLRGNVVRIKARDASDEENGFGFIVGERQGQLYIVTANHVVRSNAPGAPSRSVEVKFFTEQGQWYGAELLDTMLESMDLAVIRVNKPQGFVWEMNCLAKETGDLRDKQVWFIGRTDTEDNWYIPSLPGAINSGPNAESMITVDINNVRVGTSGAPLITETGIVGMIIRDTEGSIAQAVHIQPIENALKRWQYPWDLKPSKLTARTGDESPTVTLYVSLDKIEVHEAGSGDGAEWTFRVFANSLPVALVNQKLFKKGEVVNIYKVDEVEVEPNKTFYIKVIGDRNDQEGVEALGDIPMRWNAGETSSLEKEIPVRVPGKLMAGNFTFHFSIKRKPAPGTSRNISFEDVINQWLNNKGYVQYKPFRNDLPPASVLIVERPKFHVVMSSSEVMTNQEADRTVALVPEMISLPEVELSLNTSLPFLPEANSAALINLGVKSISLQLSGIESDGIPLNRLQAAIKNNSQLKARARENYQNLMMITEIIRASKIRVTLMGKDGRLLGDGINTTVLQNALGSDLESNMPGVVFLRKGVNLGFKAAKISLIATVLGGEVELLLNPIPTKQLLGMMSSGMAASRYPTSDFRLFGLIVAQGNYNAKSPRAGGELPGASASAQLVEDKLRQLMPPDNRDDLQLLVSRQEDGLYDPKKRITKSELVQRVTEFARLMRARKESSKPKAVIFYYFGHGLADGISHNVYLVPESFEDSPAKPVHELDELLISVDWLRDQLLQVSDNVILIIDTCRKHSGESEELRRLWGDALLQSTEAISGTLDVLKFMSGIYGPTPMLFASKDGVSAPVVRFRVGDNISDVGPLAVRLHVLFEQVSMRKETLTINDFVNRMQEPFVLPGDGKSVPDADSVVRAYTALRRDFAKDLPPQALVRSQG